MDAMNEILRLTSLVESGQPLPKVTFGDDEEGSAELNAELETGIGDALARMMMGGGKSSDTGEEFNPLTRIQPSRSEIPEAVVIHADYGQEPAPVIREMEEVPRSESTAMPKMAPPTVVRPEDVIHDEDSIENDDEFEYAEKALEFRDFQIVAVDGDGDDWIYITNPYNFDHRISFSTFNLRGYDIDTDANYEVLKKYIPIMFALLAGPALVIHQDDPTFKKFIRSSVDRKIAVDKSKFMIFTVENTNDKMYLIYLMDTMSLEVIEDGVMPGVIEKHLEADLFVQLANTALNPIINPYGMIETKWPGDRASDEIDSDQKVQEFCRIMMEELQIVQVDSSKTSYQAAIANFTKQSVIGDIQKFMAALKKSKDALEAQMTPDRYVETFTDGTQENEIQEVGPDSESSEQEKPVAEVENTASENLSGSAENDLFDGVGESVPETSEEVPPAESGTSETADTSEAVKNHEPSKKPAKAGADGKKTNKKFEIPVQR